MDIHTISVKERNGLSIAWAILAAALYAISAPVSKLLLLDVDPIMMAAFLYLGAGVGMLLMGQLRRKARASKEDSRFSRSDLPYILGMIGLDIAAPILLMLGLSRTTSANAALLNNFEIVATSVIALVVFHEAVGKRLWLAIGLITLSSIILSFEGEGSFRFSVGSALVLLACVCWGFENNCTRMLSAKDPLRIVVVKGLGSGVGSLLIAFASGAGWPQWRAIPAVLLLGFVSYGLSIFFYVRAQRTLGAAKTSAYYAIAPFISVFFSLLIFRDLPGLPFWLALVIMLLGAVLAAKEET